MCALSTVDIVEMSKSADVVYFQQRYSTSNTCGGHYNWRIQHTCSVFSCHEKTTEFLLWFAIVFFFWIFLVRAV